MHTEPPSRRLLTLTEVIARTRLSPATLHRMRGKGTFPTPIKLGRSVRWLETEVDECINKAILGRHR